MLAEAFPRMNIADMNFDKRQRHTKQGITQGNTGVGKGGGVDNDEGRIVLAGGMDAFNQDVLGIALQMIECVAGGVRAGL